jgi:hypothetical protein
MHQELPRAAHGRDQRPNGYEDPVVRFVLDVGEPVGGDGDEPCGLEILLAVGAEELAQLPGALHLALGQSVEGSKSNEMETRRVLGDGLAVGQQKALVGKAPVALFLDVLQHFFHFLRKQLHSLRNHSSYI